MSAPRSNDLHYLSHLIEHDKDNPYRASVNMNNAESLEKLKLWVQIISTIALPVVVFVVGNQVQQSIATQELSKSYVQMAVDVLKTPPTPENSELRQWAVSVIDKNSPIPLSKELRDQLKQGSVDFKVTAGNPENPATGGIVMYTKCEKVADTDTAKWMIENIPDTFKECPNNDEVGIRQFKRREGPLREGEKLISYESMDVPNPPRFEKSVQCIKTKDKEMAEWLLKNYGNAVYRCSKSDEIGIVRRAAVGQ